MTSTNINIGIGDGKASSRVLRPPGGGHTDIFGASEIPVKRDMGRNASSIVEGTNNIIVPPSPVKLPEKTNSIIPTGPTKSEESTNRGRVPPGGFSSGLW